MFKTLLISATLAQTAFAAVQSIGSGGQCLQVSGTPAENSNVILGSCNSANSQQTSTGQQWVISSGNNANGVQLFGTSYCLDAQTDPAAGRQVVISTCKQNPSQIWYLTADNRIAITGGTQCLSASGSNAQTQNCGPGIASEAWTPTFLFDETSASASSSSNGTSSATGVAGGVAGGAASSAASGASAAASGTSAVAASGASAASAATSGAASGVSAAASGASGAAATATSGAGSVAGAATSGAGSVAGAATSAGGQATSGAASVAGDATSAGGAATSAAGSAAGAATSAIASAAGKASSAGFNKIALAPLSAIVGVAIGAMCIL
ncbi:uncharacterized protein I206_106799 [Kwoniella pini CBS 10737]|uniref:Ricin B lectin domain-containing protein n=1 Tax=Kwoniella pini CBS 10737 TaxID=1296096 RepID=A0A1B9I020_9TREE|nr:uncharacterized protein I206_05653 [Kwoniella pini CBS 10737]OCF48872.1 hypothetical protein I206_05653 [Kwoniella pini CBS 10737]